MSKFTVQNIIFNIDPLIKKVLAKTDCKTFDEFKRVVKKDSQLLEPGDFLECVEHGDLRRSGIKVKELKDVIKSIISNRQSQNNLIAYLSFGELKLVRDWRVLHEKTAQLRLEKAMPVGFYDIGDENFVTVSKKVDCLYSDPYAHPLDESHENLLSLMWLRRSALKPSLQVTHCFGLDKSLDLEVPIHIKQGDDYLPSVLAFKVKLPNTPKRKFEEFEITVEGKEVADVDIAERGLYVPHGNDPFSFTIDHHEIPYGTVNFPKLINGFYIQPYCNGETLKIRQIKPPVSKEEKTIYTHLWSVKKQDTVPAALQITAIPYN